MVAGFPKKGGTGGNHAVLPADREKKKQGKSLGKKRNFLSDRQRNPGILISSCPWFYVV